MYDPRREIEEAVYNYFAERLKQAKLSLAPDLFQSLRVKVAEASEQNALLAEALAEAAGVSRNTDLVSAAKAAAVVETLDEIAYAASGQYLDARRAIMAGPSLTPQAPADERKKAEQFRKLHAELCRQWDQRQLSPRGLRLALVEYYIAQGQRQLDGRFFESRIQAPRGYPGFRVQDGEPPAEDR
jgi:hypothetical protein